jgi:hypothetical protein
MGTLESPSSKVGEGFNPKIGIAELFKQNKTIEILNIMS